MNIIKLAFEEQCENIENRFERMEEDILNILLRSPLPNEQWIEERLRALELQIKYARQSIDFIYANCHPSPQ